MITTDKKETDVNGYELRYDVPMTKIGVFPYLGKTISPELEPDRIYYVLRPKEELTNEETLKSLEEIPFVDEHTMIGEGFTPAEQKGIHGVTGKNVKVNGDLITNDLKVYSDKLKKLIDSGKRDLSMGYRCRYELLKGEYNGQLYDAIQRDIRFNHIALVDEGRMGAECRVTDSAIVYDSLDVFDEWITVHPNGKEHKGQPLYVNEGESYEQAINRKYPKNSQTKKSQTSFQNNVTQAANNSSITTREQRIKTLIEKANNISLFESGDIEKRAHEKLNEQINGLNLTEEEKAEQQALRKEDLKHAQVLG